MNGTPAWLIVVIVAAVFTLSHIAGTAWATSQPARAPGDRLSRVLTGHGLREAMREAQQGQDGGEES